MRRSLRAQAGLLTVLGALAGAASAPADQTEPVANCVPSSTSPCPAPEPSTAPCVSAPTAPCPAPTPPATTCVPAPAAQCPAAAPSADTVLSNETTFTTWAYAASTSPVHRAPADSSPRITNLRLSTEDGFPEVYIVLRQRQVAGRTWAEVRVPSRPSGQTGWVARPALDDFNRIDTELVLNRATERLRLFRSGHLVLTVPAAVGAANTPTPAGHFWLREAFPVSGVGAYGPFAFGTSAYSNVTDWPGGGVVGLHGTNQPQLVPGRPSHGCIRVRNADILRLSRLVSVGTPLLVT